MTIQFQCGVCQQTLAVPDEIGGKQAKCPNCAAVLDVPAAPPAPNPLLTPAATGTAPSFGPSAANPYGAPTAAAPMPRAGGEFGPASLDAGLALSTAWQLFQKNAGVLIGATVVMMFIQQVLGQLNNVIGMVMADGGGQPGPGFFIAILVVSLVSNIVNLFLMIGMFRMCIAIARNEPMSFGMLFSGMPFLLPFFAVYLLFSIASGVGFLLLIVPGVYVVLTYWPSMWLVIDRQTGVFESFSVAGQLAAGNRGDSFVLGLIAFGLCVLGFLMCIIGLIATLPLTYLMSACGYLMMTNQKFDGHLS